MSKKETIEKLQYWINRMGELKDFLEGIQAEDVSKRAAPPQLIQWLQTACEYLEVNLGEIRNRVRMS